MSNTQVAALVRSLLMIGGAYFAAKANLDPTTAQGLISEISATIGLGWHHYAALKAK